MIPCAMFASLWIRKSGAEFSGWHSLRTRCGSPLLGTRSAITNLWGASWSSVLFHLLWSFCSGGRAKNGARRSHEPDRSPHLMRVPKGNRFGARLTCVMGILRQQSAKQRERIRYRGDFSARGWRSLMPRARVQKITKTNGHQNRRVFAPGACGNTGATCPLIVC